MGKRFTNLRVLAVGLLFVSGCTAAEPVAEPVEDIEFINASSVLFPIPQRDQKQFEDSRTLFWMGEVDLPPVTVSVVSTSEVYSGPGITYELVDLLLGGDQLTYDGKVGHWLRIADNGGYVSEVSALGTPWATDIVGTGDESVVNLCAGGLVNFTRIAEDINRPYFVIRSYCGGEPLQKISVGESLFIAGAEYLMTSVRVLDSTGNSTQIEDMPGDALIHTDDISRGESIVISVKKVA
jgi:hypothetical protein